MGKGSAPRPIPNPDKFRDNWDAIFGIKKDPKTLEDHVWNDKMKDYQIGVDLAMIKGEKEEKK